MMNGKYHIGTVIRSSGGLYFGDDLGYEKFSSDYEVLTCKIPKCEFLK
jgi:hypothetical protein